MTTLSTSRQNTSTTFTRMGSYEMGSLKLPDLKKKRIEISEMINIKQIELAGIEVSYDHASDNLKKIRGEIAKMVTQNRTDYFIDPFREQMRQLQEQVIALFQKKSMAIAIIVDMQYETEALTKQIKAIRREF